MKLYPYAIFDMDGTLIDSMDYWRYAPIHFLKKKYPNFPDELIQKIIFKRGYRSFLNFCAEHNAPLDPKEMDVDVLSEMMDAYSNRVVCKSKTIELLESLKASGVKSCIITASPHHLVDAAMKRTGLLPYFDFILTPEDTPDLSGKEKDTVFEIAMSRFGCKDPSQYMYFEDALYGIKTGKRLGYHIYAVEDYWSKNEKEEILSLCDEYLLL